MSMTLHCQKFAKGSTELDDKQKGQMPFTT